MPKFESENADLANALANSMLCLQSNSIQLGDGRIRVFAQQDNKRGCYYNFSRAILTVKNESWLIDEIAIRRLRGLPILSDHYPMFQATFEYKRTKYNVKCGEASGNGAYGYAILSETDSQKVVWQLFLDSFNPFEYFWEETGRLHFLSTSGWSCSIPFVKPETVICMKWENFHELEQYEVVKLVNDYWKNEPFPPYDYDWLV